jgi:hypothetical protein
MGVNYGGDIVFFGDFFNQIIINIAVKRRTDKEVL